MESKRRARSVVTVGSLNKQEISMSMPFSKCCSKRIEGEESASGSGLAPLKLARNDMLLLYTPSSPSTNEFDMAVVCDSRFIYRSQRSD